MRFPCTVEQIGEKLWWARHAGPQAGSVEVRGTTRDEVVEKLTGELRYRLELCPCTGETYQHIQIEIVEERERSQ